MFCLFVLQANRSDTVKVTVYGGDVMINFRVLTFATTDEFKWGMVKREVIDK